MNAKHFAEYFVMNYSSCGGVSIKKWDNGSSSNYGTLKNISNCKETCNMHDECEGFDHRLSTDVCGFWKRAPLRLKWDSKHHCFVKRKGSTILYV